MEHKKIWCGWLSPDGEFSHIAYMQHRQFAYNKCIELGIEVPEWTWNNESDIVDESDALQEAGWISFSYSIMLENSAHCFMRYRPTKEQNKWFDKNVTEMNEQQVTQFMDLSDTYKDKSATEYYNMLKEYRQMEE